MLIWVAWTSSIYIESRLWPSHEIQASLCSSEGSTLLTHKEAILQRWSERFEGLLSDKRTVQEFSLAKIS